MKLSIFCKKNVVDKRRLKALNKLTEHYHKVNKKKF